MAEVLIDLEEMHEGSAKLLMSNAYCKSAVDRAGRGNIVIITGKAPVWMYLRIAHALAGKAAALYYEAPTTGRVCIFDHTP